ncbi:MAG: rRNA pseudouridine synthase [Flavobacteriia bacterium]|nr:rRNA pseudouridine synthase [Flavobacteriia bacterium]
MNNRRPNRGGGRKPNSSSHPRGPQARGSKPQQQRGSKPAHADSSSEAPKKFYKPKRRQAENIRDLNQDMRLNRFLSVAGISSRREADNLIQAGLVSINGKVVTELGTKVKSSDEVRYNGELIRAEAKQYLLLNKPKGFLTTMDDPRARKTVMDLIGGACKERIYPVGRLDRATTGVLLFTNDGDLAKKLTHPSHGARKIYAVQLDKNFKRGDFDTLLAGVELEDGKIAPDALSYIDEKSKSQIGVEIHSGKNRIVRRMFEHLGYEVIKLDRTSFAGLTKKSLNRGHYRFLTKDEVNFLKTR